MLKFLVKVLWMLIFFQNCSRYLPHIWYGPILEHWLLLYKTMALGLAPGWGQSSVSSRMMLMLKFLVKVFSNSFKTSLRFLLCIWLASSLEN